MYLLMWSKVLKAALYFLLFQYGFYSRILGVSSVAQLVEHVAVNHRVAGSSPARGASGSDGCELRLVSGLYGALSFSYLY